MVGLDNRAMEIPTVVHVAPDGGLSVGELAERQATTDPTGIAREFKRRVGDTTPIYAGGATFTPEGLTAHVLRWVVEQTVERVGERPAQVTLDFIQRPGPPSTSKSWWPQPNSQD